MNLREFNDLYEEMNLTDSKEFATKLNKYFDKLNEEEKNLIIQEIKEEYYSTKDKDKKSDCLRLFTMLKYEKKYSILDTQMIYHLLKSDVTDDNEKLSIIMHNQYNDGVSYYLSLIQHGEQKKLDISMKQIIDINSKISNGHDNELDIVRVASAIDSKNIIEYIYQKPDKYIGCINDLSYEDGEQLLSNINDERYKAKLLLNVNAEPSIIAKFFPHIEDDFIRDQIIIAKTDNKRFHGNKNTIKKIDEFLNIKKQFIEMTEKEKVEFLENFSTNYDKENGLLTHKDRNDLKNSLLEYIPDVKDRKKIIDTFEFYVDPNIRPIFRISTKMIVDFCRDNFKLTDEQWEKIDKSIMSSDYFFEPYRNRNINGMTYHVDRNISLGNHKKGDDLNNIINMTHEIAHAISNFDFLRSGEMIDEVYEEGMADTFAELVVNHCLSRHKSFTINGRRTEPRLPVVSESSYYRENAWVKSMLYPLSKNRKDMEAIQEYYLGDKKEFFDMCLWEGFTEKNETNYLGLPKGVIVSTDDLIRANGEAYEKLDKTSIFMIKNDGIKTLSQIAQKRHLTKLMEDRMKRDVIKESDVISASRSFTKEQEYIEVQNKDEESR